MKKDGVIENDMIWLKKDKKKQRSPKRMEKCHVESMTMKSEKKRESAKKS